MEQEVRSSDIFTMLANLMDSQSNGIQSSQNNNNNSNPTSSMAMRHNVRSDSNNNQARATTTQDVNVHILNIAGHSGQASSASETSGTNRSATNVEIADIERLSAFMHPNFGNTSGVAASTVSSDTLYESTNHMGIVAEVSNSLDSRVPVPQYPSNTIDFTSSQNQAAILDALNTIDTAASLSGQSGNRSDERIFAQSYVSLLHQQTVDAGGGRWPVDSSLTGLSLSGNFSGTSGITKQRNASSRNSSVHGPHSLSNNAQSSTSLSMDKLTQSSQSHIARSTNSSRSTSLQMQRPSRMESGNKVTDTRSDYMLDTSLQFGSGDLGTENNNILIGNDHIEDRSKEKKLTTTPIPSDADKSSCSSTSSGSVSGPEQSPDHVTERSSSSSMDLSQHHHSGLGSMNREQYQNAQENRDDLSAGGSKNYPCYGNMNVLNFGTINFSPVMDSTTPNLANVNGPTVNVQGPTSESAIEIDAAETNSFQNIRMLPSTPKAADPSGRMSQRTDISNPSCYTQMQTVSSMSHLAHPGAMSSHSQAGFRTSKSKGGNSSRKPPKGHMLVGPINNSLASDFSGFNSSTQDKMREKHKKSRSSKHRQTQQQSSQQVVDGSEMGESNIFGFNNVGQSSNLKPKVNADPTSKIISTKNSYQFNWSPQAGGVFSHGSNSKLLNVISGKHFQMPGENTKYAAKHGDVIAALPRPNTAHSRQPRQWQTVTAVQGPKLPPMLSEQDRIPKRGRPSKKMMQQNLKIKKDAEEVGPSPTIVQPPAAPQPKVSQATQPSSNLVSMYTINDKGLMEEIAPKVKENRRSKERTQAFLKFLDDIKSASKQQLATNSKFGDKAKTSTDKQVKRKSRPKTKVFGRPMSHPLTESGITETMYTFSALAHQYKISSSIVERATENLLKSAAVKRSKELSAMAAEQQRLAGKNKGTQHAFDKIAKKGVTLVTTHCETMKTTVSSKVPNVPTIKLPNILYKKADRGTVRPIPSCGQFVDSNLQNMPVSQSVSPKTTANNGYQVLVDELTTTPVHANIQSIIKSPEKPIQKITEHFETVSEQLSENTEALPFNINKGKHKKKKHKKHKKHKHLDSSSGKKKKKDKERKKKSKKKFKTKLGYGVIPSSSVSLVKPPTKAKLVLGSDAPKSNKATSKEQDKKPGLFSQRTGFSAQINHDKFSSDFRQGSSMEFDNSNPWQQEDNMYDPEDSSSDETSTSLKSSIDTSSESFTTPVSTNSLSSFVQYSTSRIGFGTFSAEKPAIIVELQNNNITSPVTVSTVTDQVDSFTTQSQAQSSKKHSKHKKKKFFRKSKNICDPAFKVVLDELLICFKNLELDSLRNHRQIPQSRSYSNIFFSTNITDAPRTSLWRSPPSATAHKNETGSGIVKGTVFLRDPQAMKASDAEISGFVSNKSNISHEGSKSKDCVNSLSVFCSSFFFQKYGYVSKLNQETPFASNSPLAIQQKKKTESKSQVKNISTQDVSTSLPNNTERVEQDDMLPRRRSMENVSEVKRKRGWPRGKPRGPRAKKGRVSSAPQHAKSIPKSVSLPNHESRSRSSAHVEDYTSANSNTNKKISFPNAHFGEDISRADTTVEVDMRSKDSPVDGCTKSDASPSTSASKKHPFESTINDKIVGESLMWQIRQAIEASLPASVNKDAITKSVDAAVQNYLDNMTKTQQSSTNEKPDCTDKKVGQRQTRSGFLTIEDSANTKPPIFSDASPKVNADKHPKKVWACKHQDTEFTPLCKEKLQEAKDLAPIKRRPGRPRKQPTADGNVESIPSTSAVRPVPLTISKQSAGAYSQGKVPTTSATVIPSKRRTSAVRMQVKCVKPAVKRLLARARNDITNRTVPGLPTPSSSAPISKEEAVASLRALCSVKTVEIKAKQGAIEISEPGMYSKTVVDDHIKEVLNLTVEMHTWDNHKKFEESCSEIERDMGFTDDFDANKPKNIGVKKSIESVVEKLKSKQAQNMHSAAAALLELHNTSLSSDADFHESVNVYVMSDGDDTTAKTRMGRRPDVYENVSSMKKIVYQSSKAKKNLVVAYRNSDISIKRPRGRPRKIPDEEPPVKKMKSVNADKYMQKSAIVREAKNQMKNNKCKQLKTAGASTSTRNPQFSSRKTYLEAGLYSSTFKRNPKSSKKSTTIKAVDHLSPKLPPPFDAGLFLRSTLKDFQLPYNIWWMYKHKKISVSQNPSTNFVKITENVYTNPRPALDLGDHICTCNPSMNENCGRECLNRLMYFECLSSSCPSGVSCTNQAIQKRTWCGSLNRFKTNDRGWGIRTTEQINEGSFILEYVGEVMSEAEFRIRTIELYHAYNDHFCVQLDTSTVIDGYRMANEGRFVNHSCEPNCEMQKWCVNGQHRVGLFALQQIRPNEELTYDYNFHAYDVDTQQSCRCGSQHCRGLIGGRSQRSLTMDNMEISSIHPLSVDVKSTKSSGRRSKISSHRSKDEDLGTKEFSILHMKPISKHDKEIIRYRQLFLLRNLMQVRRKEEEQHDGKVSKRRSDNSQTTISSAKPSHKTKSKKGQQSKEEKEKVEAALTEMYTAIATCKDQNGVSVAIPFMNLPSKKKNPEYYERISNPIDLSVIERNIVSNHYKDIETFNSDVQRVFKNAEKYHGRKSTLGKDVIRLRKAYANARGAAMLLLNGHKKMTALSEVSDGEDIDEADENFHKKNEDHIRCICCIYKDEGLMVQCEKCYVWQHCDCMGVKPGNTDRYLCEECDPRPFSREVKVIPPPPNTPPGHTYFVTLLRDNLLVKQGDCAYLMRDHRLRQNSTLSMRASHRNIGNIPQDKLDIFRVEQLWTDERGDKYAYGHHFLRPHETHHSPSRTFYHNELFASPFNEIIPLEAVVGLCCVMDLYTYCKGKPKEFKMADIFICDFRVDKAAGLFTRITKKRYPICTKPHVFDMYKHKICPKKNFQPHQVPEQYKKSAGRPPASNEISDEDALEFGSAYFRGRSDEECQTEEGEPIDGCDVGSPKWKKRQRLNRIARILLSKLPKQAVDVSYLLEPGSGKRQRKKTQLSLESLSQQK